jgi:hypothetical protein
MKYEPIFIFHKPWQIYNAKKKYLTII